MTLDIKGGLKNTKPSSNPYVVIEELISNSIDAFLIKENLSHNETDLKITLSVEIETDTLNHAANISITCQDNGIGFGPEQLDAFLTKDTSYKDELKISGLAKSRGAGRIQFFHHFININIESYFSLDGEISGIEMKYIHPQSRISSDSFKKFIPLKKDVGTTISFFNLHETTKKQLERHGSLSEIFSGDSLKNAVYISQLQRLISLKKELGNFSIEILCRDKSQDKEEVKTITVDDLPNLTEEENIKVEKRDPRTGISLNDHENFKISHYTLDASVYNMPKTKNVVAFCAKSSPVVDITKRYLPIPHEQEQPQNGCYHIIFIESVYLDTHVNERRDGFDSIPENIPNNDFLSVGEISLSLIHI